MNLITIPNAGMSLGCAGPLDATARPVPRLTVARIQEEVARYYTMPLREMTAHRRSQPHARYRQTAMFLARELTGQSLPNIGKLFGGRDHTTVMHAIRTIEALLFDDTMLAQDIADIKARLG